MKKFNNIDLFCGAGGLSVGLEKAGFAIPYAIEFDPTYASTYKSNHKKTHVTVGDIKDISNEEISEIGNSIEIDMISGGPPCQGFSIAGNIARRFLDDERNSLFLEFVRFVRILKPKIFLVENVANMVTHNKGKTIIEIVNKFEDLGYTVQYKILNSVNFKVPQERRRVFIVGTLNGYSFIYPKESNKRISIKEAIDDLPKLSSGEKSNIPLHFAMNHSEQMLKKMSYISNGGTRLQIPVNLRPTSGDARKYIRFKSELPAFCVTGDMRKIFHYNQNRALTLRELARLQTFPDNYSFFGNSIQIQQQIGNAVPCNLAYEIGKELFRTLNETK